MVIAAKIRLCPDSGGGGEQPPSSSLAGRSIGVNISRAGAGGGGRLKTPPCRHRNEISARRGREGEGGNAPRRVEFRGRRAAAEYHCTLYRLVPRSLVAAFTRVACPSSGFRNLFRDFVKTASRVGRKGPRREKEKKGMDSHPSLPPARNLRK